MVLSPFAPEVLALLQAIVSAAANPSRAIVAWCEPCEPQKSLTDVTWTRQRWGQWQFVIVSPRALEMCGDKALRDYCLTGLGLVRYTPDARVFLPCVYEKSHSPCAIRHKMFDSLPEAEGIGPAFGADQAAAVLEDLGLVDVDMVKVEGSLALEAFFAHAPDAEAVKAVADWLRVNVEMCKRALPNELGALRRLCDPQTLVIRQAKALFSVRAAPGFNHDDYAQPSREAWWPEGDRTTFVNHGLVTWNQIRQEWTRPVANHGHVPLPKLSPQALTDLVDSLATTQDRIELPRPMRLDDLLDVLVDVWDSLEE